jgi:hypothetical protein
MLKDVFAAIAAILFYGILFVWLYNRFLKKSIDEAAKQKWYYFPVMLLITGF